MNKAKQIHVKVKDDSQPEINNLCLRVTEPTETGVWLQDNECSYFVEHGKYEEALPRK